MAAKFDAPGGGGPTVSHSPTMGEADMAAGVAS